MTFSLEIVAAISVFEKLDVNPDLAVLNEAALMLSEFLWADPSGDREPLDW